MKKQKTLTVLLLALILSCVALRPAITSAATVDVTVGTYGTSCNSGGYVSWNGQQASNMSISVTSGDKITFSVPGTDLYGGGVQVNDFPQGSFVVPRGGSVTTQALTANVSFHGTWPNDPNCPKGSGTVTVQAAATPPTPPSSGSGSSSPTTTPTSSGTTSPTATSTPKTTTKPSSTPTPTPSSTATQPTTVPDTVVADTITVAGKQVTPTTEGEILTINQSQPLVLSGTTIPNGKLTLTIHSNPITATVQADASGYWSYTVTSSLPAGNHTIYAAVTNPTTNQTSATSKLLAFTIKAAPVSSVTRPVPTPTKKSSSPLVPMALAAVGLLIIVAAVVVVLKKMKRGDTANIPAAQAISPVTVQPMPQQAVPIEQQPVPAPPVNPTSYEGNQVSPAPDTNGSNENQKEQL